MQCGILAWVLHLAAATTGLHASDCAFGEQCELGELEGLHLLARRASKASLNATEGDPAEEGCYRCINEREEMKWCPIPRSGGGPGRCEPQVSGRVASSCTDASGFNAWIRSRSGCFSAGFKYQLTRFVVTRDSKTKGFKEYGVKAVLGSFTKKYQFPPCPKGETCVYDMEDSKEINDVLALPASTSKKIRFAIASDWGSGTREAHVIAQLMMKNDPDYTFHLGDIYWVGTPKEFDDIVGVPDAVPDDGAQRGTTWPKGKRKSFLLNGNHEMLSGGKGYFVNGFRYTGQRASYSAWQSNRWRFICLDSAYDWYRQSPTYAPFIFNPFNLHEKAWVRSGKQPNVVIQWLRDVVKIQDDFGKGKLNRGIVLFTHHQPISDWVPAWPGTAKQLAAMLPPNTKVIWFFGHEHRFAIYNEHEMKFTKGWGIMAPRREFSLTIFGRMIGHGGYLIERGPPRVALGDMRVRLYDNTEYMKLNGKSCGRHGFAEIVVDGNTLSVQYLRAPCPEGPEGCRYGYNTRTDKPDVVFEETFTVDDDGQIVHTPGEPTERLVDTGARAPIRSVPPKPSDMAVISDEEADATLLELTEDEKMELGSIGRVVRLLEGIALKVGSEDDAKVIEDTWKAIDEKAKEEALDDSEKKVLERLRSVIVKDNAELLSKLRASEVTLAEALGVEEPPPYS